MSGLTRERALAIVERLGARSYAGELPAMPEGTMVEVVPALRALPIEDLVPLHGRAMFEPGKLDERSRFAASFSRGYFFADLGEALGCSPREVIAAINGRQFPLVPPRVYEGFEYLGKLTTDGVFVVSDPCYVAKSPSDGSPLCTHVEVERGVWHAYARPAAREPNTYTAELLVVHESGFDVAAAEALGFVGVDSGMAGVFDRSRAKARIESSDLSEGIYHGQGAVTSSGNGDGGYTAFGGRARSGAIVKIRIPFLGPHPPELAHARPRPQDLTRLFVFPEPARSPQRHEVALCDQP